METISFNSNSIDLDLSHEKTLYLNYMPFINGCGLFCPTEENFDLGSDILVNVSLPNDLGNYKLTGRVVWLNPPKKAGRRVPGVGLQFAGEQAKIMRTQIETLLDKKLTSPFPTSTI